MNREMRTGSQKKRQMHGRTDRQTDRQKCDNTFCNNAAKTRTVGSLRTRNDVGCSYHDNRRDYYDNAAVESIQSTSLIT